MGHAAAGEVARSVIAAGRHPDTPALVAVDVSLPMERLIRDAVAGQAFAIEQRDLAQAC